VARLVPDPIEVGETGRSAKAVIPDAMMPYPQTQLKIRIAIIGYLTELH